VELPSWRSSVISLNGGVFRWVRSRRRVFGVGTTLAEFMTGIDVLEKHNNYFCNAIQVITIQSF
jgi:hypothetical protein